MKEKIEKILSSFAEERLFSHAFFEIGNIAGRKKKLRVTHFPDDRRVFDLASLSKLFSTSFLIVEYGRARNKKLENTVKMFFGEKVTSTLPHYIANMTVRDLLSHTSGLPAWRNFYVRCGAQKTTDPILNVFQRIKRKDLNDKHLYSDLGFIILGYFLTRVTKQPLDTLFNKWCDQNGIDAEIGYDIKDKWPKTIPTGFCPLRNRIVDNEVHDENAAFMGEFCGHTGLFASGADFSKFLQHALKTEDARTLIEKSFSRDSKKFRSVTCGFRPADDPGSHDFYPGAAIGHYGFTGTSFWLHPPSGNYVFFLCNRTLYSRLDVRIKKLRSQLSKIAYEYCR